jgi:acetyl-CoA carboxylase carboxyl transferase subunit beta
MLFDDGDYKEFELSVVSTDPLEFVDHKSYTDRLAGYHTKKGKTDAVRNAIGKLGGRSTIICCMDFGFMGGSMGSVVGEKITRAIELALEQKTPVIIICASGGARMQEGALSLMQMGKVSLALAKMDKARLPFISVLTDPTTGGTTASYAMLGDFNIAEPKALIGFAGPRVIQQTIRQDLPEGFQRSEFLLEHGMIDRIVSRANMREELIKIISLLYNEEAIEAAANM